MTYQLTGLQRTYLEDWLSKHPVTDEDREAADIADVDPDGMVVWRKGTVSEHLEYVVAKWLWEESGGGFD